MGMTSKKGWTKLQNDEMNLITKTSLLKDRNINDLQHRAAARSTKEGSKRVDLPNETEFYEQIIEPLSVDNAILRRVTAYCTAEYVDHLILVLITTMRCPNI